MTAIVPRSEVRRRLASCLIVVTQLLLFAADSIAHGQPATPHERQVAAMRAIRCRRRSPSAFRLEHELRRGHPHAGKPIVAYPET
jgi:hypothetical protein